MKDLYFHVDEVSIPNPQFDALEVMIENESEICLGHPVAIKYINVKWIKRGFIFCLLSIFLNLIVHICLLTHVILVVGEVGKLLCTPSCHHHTLLEVNNIFTSKFKFSTESQT